jgi:putative transposase
MRTHKYLKIDKQTQKDLYEFIESSKARERRRAIAILMSNDKKSVSAIAEQLGKNPDTVYDWLNNFTAYGLEGLKDKPITGRPKKLKEEDQNSIEEVLKKSS